MSAHINIKKKKKKKKKKEATVATLSIEQTKKYCNYAHYNNIYANSYKYIKGKKKHKPMTEKKNIYIYTYIYS